MILFANEFHHTSYKKIVVEMHTFVKGNVITYQNILVQKMMSAFFFRVKLHHDD